jgi:tripeptide aminopeptidase
VLPRNASIAELFMALVAIPSPSRHERAVGDEIRDWLKGAGIEACYDRAGAANGSDAGNLIATVPGDSAAPSYLFIAHMDTVEAGSPPVAPRLGDDGVIRSAGDTILGADNKAAVAAVMGVCAHVARMPVAGRPTVVGAFTCCEEHGRMGASLLDESLLERIDCAFCVDGSRPIGTVITRALGQTVFGFTVHGRAAHAAANPEAGVNAIRVASEVVAQLPLGRLDGGGSAGVAAIVGGPLIDRLSPASLQSLGVPAQASGTEAVMAAIGQTPTNSVPDRAIVRGEVRGYSVEEIEAAVGAIHRTLERVCDQHGATFEWVRDRQRMVPPFPAPGTRALELVRRAAEAAAVPLVCEERQATLEANYLTDSTDVVAVASGARDPHQTSESIPVAELERLEALLVAIVELGRPG